MGDVADEDANRRQDPGAPQAEQKEGQEDERQ